MANTSNTIAGQIEDMQKDSPAMPEGIANIFATEQARLRQVSPRSAIALADTVNDISLLDVHGAETTLSEATTGRPTVVVLYRGAWCPYCNLTLRTYQQHLLPALAERTVGLIAISPQAPDGSLSSAEKNALAYPVLSDPGNQLARQLGILTAPSAEARAVQLQLGLDLAVVNADGTAELPMPSTLILDGGLRMRWLDVHPDYSTRSEVADILDALDNLDL
jgi:peroxiredoxin